MTTVDAPPPASVLEHSDIQTKTRWHDHPLLHGVVLAGLFVQALVVSWRKWPDPVVDFGRELYIPWRLSEGAVLYRDVDDFYGPLSHYFNAGLFSVFGPGLMVLAWANIVFFGAMAGLLYALLRKAWGGLAALLGASLFVAVFGCCRFSGTGSFNYISPYAHEATHGVLVLLVLLWTADRWLAKTEWRSAGVMGLMLGLALVLKAEIILVAVVVCLGAFGVLQMAGKSMPRTSLQAFTGAAALPSLAFFAYFSQHLPVGEAWTAAGRAWYNVVGTAHYMAEAAQLSYAGLDSVGPNLIRHVLSVLGAAVVLVLLVGIVAYLKQLPAFWSRIGGPLLVLATAASALAAGQMWVEVGRCLLGLQLLYAGFMVIDGLRQGVAVSAHDERWRLRLLFVLLGIALMVRMVLNGRLGQFGFYQAAIGAVVVLAVLVAELPERVRLTLAQERRLLRTAMVALMLAGGFCLTREAYFNYRAVNTPMGEGRDRFFVWNELANLNRPLSALQSTPKGHTVLVLPEGLMFNYLLRRRSPVSTLYSAVMDEWRETIVVEQLEADPPEWVLLVPRDLGEYRVTRYGERSGAGRDLLEWVGRDYVEASTGRSVSIEPGRLYLFRRHGLVEVASR